MKTQGQSYVNTQLERFILAKKALLLDDDNYAAHEEKRTELLSYYQERIDSYEKQQRKFNEQGKNGSAVKKTIKVTT